MDGDGSSYDSAEASQQALRGIKRALGRHPVVGTIRGFPEGEFTQIVAALATDRIAIDVEEATLTVSWFAGDTAASRPEFSFHYSDPTGDFGWHHHPQDHVDEWGHFQERAAGERTYAYEPHTFSSTNPTRVTWEVMARLTTAFDSR